ncbi:MAG: ABC transporter permease [Candidatus Lokiarchaeota archaeon]
MIFENEVIDGILRALYLIFTLDPEILNILSVSVRVSGMAVIFASLIALPLGSYIGLRYFRGKKFLTNILNTFMGFPPVIMGLFIYLILSRNGPFGFLGLLYSTTAMIISQ